MGYEARRKKVLEDTNSINDKAKQNLTETQYDLWQKQVEEKMKAFNAKEAAKADKMYLFYSIIYVLCILLAISAVIVGVFFILRNIELLGAIIIALLMVEPIFIVYVYAATCSRKEVVTMINSEQEIKIKEEVFAQIIEGKLIVEENYLNDETVVVEEIVENDAAHLVRNLKDEIERNKKCEEIYNELKKYQLLKLFGKILTTLSLICLFCIPVIKSATGEVVSLLNCLFDKKDNQILTEVIKEAFELENKIHIISVFIVIMSCLVCLIEITSPPLYDLYIVVFKMTKMKINIRKRFEEIDKNKKSKRYPNFFVLNLVFRIVVIFSIYFGFFHVPRNLEENPLIEVSYLPFILCLVLYIIGSACSTKADYMLKKSDNVKRMDNYL